MLAGEPAGPFDQLWGLRSSIDQRLGDRSDDRIDVKSILAVKVGQVAGLPEAVDAERHDPVATDAAKP